MNAVRKKVRFSTGFFNGVYGSIYFEIDVDLAYQSKDLI